MSNEAEIVLRELLEKCFYTNVYGDIKSSLDRTRTVSGVDPDLHTKLLPYLTDDMRRDMKGAEYFRHCRTVWEKVFETEIAMGMNPKGLSMMYESLRLSRIEKDCL